MQHTARGGTSPGKNLEPVASARQAYWLVAVLLLICAVVTALAVRFFIDIHYNNLLLQANNQAGTTQTELGKEQYDVNFLINNSGQLNCYALRSDYVRNLCFTHDHIPSQL